MYPDPLYNVYDFVNAKVSFRDSHALVFKILSIKGIILYLNLM
jgi:hypothetical protein